LVLFASLLIASSLAWREGFCLAGETCQTNMCCCPPEKVEGLCRSVPKCSHIDPNCVLRFPCRHIHMPCCGVGRVDLCRESKWNKDN
jgi:hypothetical protein